MPIGPWRSGARADNTTAGTTLSPAYPASVVAGELLVIVVSANASDLAGWTTRVFVGDGANTLTILYRIADGGETGSVAVTTTNTRGTAQMFAAPGVDQTTLLDVAAATAATAGAAAASITVDAGAAVTAGAVAFYAVATAGAITTFTGPGTELADFGETTPTGRAGAVYHSADLAAGGATSGTMTPAATRLMAAAVLVLRPAVTVTASPGGVTSTGAVGTPAGVAGPLTATPAGIASPGVLGTPGSGLGASGSPAGVASLGALGEPTLVGGAAVGDPDGASASFALGQPEFFGDLLGPVGGIASIVRVGTPAGMSVTAAVPTGATSQALLGVPVVLSGLIGYPDGHTMVVLLGEPSVATGATPDGESAAVLLGVPTGVGAVPPGAVNLVTLTLLDASSAPVEGVHVHARLETPGYTSEGEVVAPTEALSDPAGLVTLPLIPSSRITPTAVYVVTWAGQRRRITVPGTGPVTLQSVTIP